MAQVERITLDGQLAAYWAREAARLDALAASARFGWQARRYRRKAQAARAQGARSEARQAGHAPAAAATG